MGAQEQAERVGREYQKVAEVGFEAASHSLGEINRGFQAVAAEMTDFSKGASRMLLVRGSKSSAREISEK